MIIQMRKRLHRLSLDRAQSIVEYSIILSIVVAALIAMQVYMKRGIQAGIKFAADELGPQEAEKTDIEKGTETSSEINTKADSIQRIRSFKDGSQTMDIDNITTSSGEAEYVSWE